MAHFIGTMTPVFKGEKSGSPLIQGRWLFSERSRRELGARGRPIRNIFVSLLRQCSWAMGNAAGIGTGNVSRLYGKKKKG